MRDQTVTPVQLFTLEQASKLFDEVAKAEEAQRAAEWVQFQAANPGSDYSDYLEACEESQQYFRL